MFQNQSMGHVGRFKFLKIFHCHLLKKCFRTAVEAFKVWASKGNPAGRKFSKCVLRAKRSQKHVKIVSEWFYKLFWTFLKKLILGWKRGEKCVFFMFFFYVFFLFFFFYVFFMKNCTNIEIRSSRDIVVIMEGFQTGGGQITQNDQKNGAFWRLWQNEC